MSQFRCDCGHWECPDRLFECPDCDRTYCEDCEQELPPHDEECPAYRKRLFAEAESEDGL